MTNETAVAESGVAKPVGRWRPVLKFLAGAPNYAATAILAAAVAAGINVIDRAIQVRSGVVIESVNTLPTAADIGKEVEEFAKKLAENPNVSATLDRYVITSCKGWYLPGASPWGCIESTQRALVLARAETESGIADVKKIEGALSSWDGKSEVIIPELASIGMRTSLRAIFSGRAEAVSGMKSIELSLLGGLDVLQVLVSQLQAVSALSNTRNNYLFSAVLRNDTDYTLQLPSIAEVRFREPIQGQLLMLPLRATWGSSYAGVSDSMISVQPHSRGIFQLTLDEKRMNDDQKERWKLLVADSRGEKYTIIVGGLSTDGFLTNPNLGRKTGP